MVERNLRRRPVLDGDGVGLVVDHGRQVEDFEDAVKRHQRSQNVDLHVGKRCQRAIRPGQVLSHGDEGADRESPVDHEDAPEADTRGPWPVMP